MTAVVTKATEWRNTFMEELKAGNHLAYSSMQAFFKDFSSRHPKVSWNSASTFYYTEKRNDGLEGIELHPGYAQPAKVIENQTEIESCLDPVEIDRLERLMYEKTLNCYEEPEYKVGQLVKVMITRLVDYGAFAETLDGYKKHCLIHKSNISYDFVLDPADYFAFADEIEARVVKVDSDGKIGLSTKEANPAPKYKYNPSPVPNPKPVAAAPVAINAMANKLGPIKNMIVTSTPEKEDESSSTASTLTVPETVPPVVPPVAPPIAPAYNADELKDVQDYIRRIVGALTPEAEVAMHSLIEKFGLFKFTRVLMKEEAIFQKDLGLALAKQLENSLSQNP